MRSSRVEPEAKPVRDDAAGSTGDAGAGEAAWTRDLSPRHRRVVERFFTPEPPSAPPGAGR